MSNASNTRRFRTNPVELCVFAIATTIFAHSVYSLFSESPTFRPTALTPMATNPISEGRIPASVSQTFLNIDVKCDSNADRDTGAGKVRLTGALCGVDAATDSAKVTKTLVINNANKFNATVFTDPNSGKFSTDYIPLNAGRNPIHLEFSYRDGKSVSQDLTVTRN